jgi:hypothetical protein
MIQINRNTLEEQIQIVPTISIVFDWSNWDYENDKRILYFYIGVGWIFWGIELQIGRNLEK